MAEEIKRTEIPIVKPKLGETVRVLEFTKGEEKCSIFLILNDNEKWKKVGCIDLLPSDGLGILMEDSVCLFFRGFTKEEIEECNKDYSKHGMQQRGKYGSLFTDPFLVYPHQQNILQINGSGANALYDLSAYSHFVSKEKTFFHSAIKNIVTDSLLLKIFDK